MIICPAHCDHCKTSLGKCWNLFGTGHDIPTERIAAALGVSRQAVSYKANKLGLPSRAKVRKQYCDDATFKRLWDAGVCTTAIAKPFGYSHRQAVGHRRVVLGLTPRTRSRNGKTVRGWAQTISMAQYVEQKLANAMAREVGKVPG